MKPFETKRWFLNLLFLFSIFFCREDEKKKKRVGGRDEVQHCHRLSSPSASPSLHRWEGWEWTKASQGEASWAWEASWTPLGQQHLWSSELREKSIQGKRDWCWITQPSPEPSGQMTSHTHMVIHADTHTNTYWHTAMLSFAKSHTLTTSTHLHTHVFVCLVFLEAMLFWSSLYKPNKPQLFFPEDGKGPRFVFPSLFAPFLYLCPYMSPSTSVWQEKSFRYIKYLQGWTSSPKQLIAYSMARLERGKQLHHVAVLLQCSRNSAPKNSQKLPILSQSTSSQHSQQKGDLLVAEHDVDLIRDKV